MLLVGSGAFSAISFHTSGKSAKFSIIHKKPGVEVADPYNNPYGKLGFYSIQWWYGFLVLRPEWIAVMYTVASA
jgi:N4-gp56 family major capsid protein